MCEQFKADLKAWQEVEDKFLELLRQRNPWDEITKSEWYFTWRDIIMKKTDWTSMTFEVKFDRMVWITGNVAIEVAFAWHPSWICSSKADYLVYYCKDLFRYAKPKEVYNKLIEYERIFWGDAKMSELILVRREDFINIFQRRW